MMKKYVLQILAILSLLLPAMTAQGGEKSLRIDERTLNNLLSTGIVEGLSVEESAESIIRKLGKPATVKKKKIKNVEGNSEDNLEVLDYDGLRLTFYKYNNPNNGWEKLVEVAVSSTKWPLKYGLSLGMPFQEFKEAFVRAEWQRISSKKGSVTYAVMHQESVHEQIVVEEKGGKIRRLSWSDWP